ncbi:hypothetical protein AAES_74556 [Amazona aestiva]|uniref:Protein FAM136A n=1 Tax=Amazona aestiva TaxID=12930 RepID=A0A0Q3PMX5_AMAAE|nr:hypothetical protein AAES_74556 [Amazona aestiva]
MDFGMTKAGLSGVGGEEGAWELGQMKECACGVLLAACHALENTTANRSAPGPPVAAAVRSHFNDCPDSHSQFCFHGTCRFLVQEDKPACVCHSGYVGTRCEHADLLAVVAANQKKQTITVLVVVSVVASALLIGVCVLIHPNYKGTMFRCSARCCEDSTASMQQVQRCIERCHAPLAQAQAIVTAELESFQDRLSRCTLHCNDKAKDALDAGTAETKVRGQLDACLAACGDDHVRLVPAMAKKMKDSLGALQQ